MSLSFAVKQIKLWCFENVPLRGTQPPTVLVLWSSFVRRCFTLSSFHSVTHWSVWTESLIHLLSFCLPPSSWRSSWRKRWVTLKVWMRRPCVFAITSKTSSLSGFLRFLILFCKMNSVFRSFTFQLLRRKVWWDFCCFRGPWLKAEQCWMWSLHRKETAPCLLSLI